MPSAPVLADLDAATASTLPCRGIKSPDRERRYRKNRWLRRTDYTRPRRLLLFHL